MNFNQRDRSEPTDVELLAAAREKLGDQFGLMVGWMSTDGVNGLFCIHVAQKGCDSWKTPVRSETRAGLMEAIELASRTDLFNSNQDWRFN